MKVVALSVDSPGDSKALRERVGVGFPLLYDEEARVAEAYGVKMKDQNLAIPATILVTPEGQVGWQYVGERPPDRPAEKRVLEQIDALLGG